MNLLARVTVTIPAEMLEHIDRLDRNRSRFVADAVRHELERRRREGLLDSIRNPHPESIDMADAGLADWTQELSPKLSVDDALVDATTGTAVRWVEGQGWIKGSK